MAILKPESNKIHYCIVWIQVLFVLLYTLDKAMQYWMVNLSDIHVCITWCLLCKYSKTCLSGLDIQDGRRIKGQDSPGMTNGPDKYVHARKMFIKAVQGPTCYLTIPNQVRCSLKQVLLFPQYIKMVNSMIVVFVESKGWGNLSRSSPASYMLYLGLVLGACSLLL